MSTSSGTRRTTSFAPTDRDAERARQLVFAFGWNAMSYQIVNDGICHWFSRAGDAVVGYARTRRIYVVVGAPVCAEHRLSAVLEEWEAFAASLGCRCCYFGAAGRLFDRLRLRAGYSTALLGAQPVWHPAEWPAVTADNASLRSQMHRARNKGVVVTEWTSDRASADPRLHRCLSQWLERRGLPALHFLIEPFTLHDLTGRRVFVAERGDAVVGFLNASPIPARTGWLVEQFIRSADAPNGTIEILIDRMMCAVAADGAQYVTLGLVPLQRVPSDGTVQNPAWLNMFFSLARMHGNRFYNFRGLERFKTKLRPHNWEPIYAISNEPTFSFATLYAITTAFTVAPPLMTLAHGIARAVQIEARRIRNSLRRAIRQ